MNEGIEQKKERPEGEKTFLLRLGEMQLPRILTQVCRDPGSPFNGSCDRNWWHYKIRDFPSIILQQAGYALAEASKTGAGVSYSADLRKLASATCRFWNRRAVRRGAFEEYYPFEQGYPPLAFSALAVAKMCSEGIIQAEEISEGLEIAAYQLLKRWEEKASNQQIAGTAALAVIRRIAPSLVPEGAFSRLLARTLAAQERDGWFPEYDGPDLGYLSVSLDCLWDLFDATGEEGCHDAILKGFSFLRSFVVSPLGSAGMHNARNTDYIVPYGIARLSTEASETGKDAAEVFARLFAGDSGGSHPLYAVDDRYWCHYVGHSVYRATGIMERSGLLPPDSGTPDRRPGCFPLQGYERSGHFMLRSDDSEMSPQVLVSAKKGAILSAVWPEGQTACDYGWIVRRRRRAYVSHWWSPEWRVSEIHPHSLRCDGHLYPHKEIESSPLKHVILRTLSWVFGRRIIPLLKKAMIFKKKDDEILFHRTVFCKNQALEVEDLIEGIKPSDEILRAPRSSMRYVASADNFHAEDFALLYGVFKEERWKKGNGSVRIKTIYSP